LSREALAEIQTTIAENRVMAALAAEVVALGGRSEAQIRRLEAMRDALAAVVS